MKKADLLELLRPIQDPELKVSIVDLGLIYNVALIKSEAIVTMTLTTPLCPLAPQIEAEIKLHLLKSADVKSVEINLVWEPVWDPSTMASDEIKDMLGLW